MGVSAVLCEENSREAGSEISLHAWTHPKQLLVGGAILPPLLALCSGARGEEHHPLCSGLDYVPLALVVPNQL